MFHSLLHPYKYKVEEKVVLDDNRVGNIIDRRISYGKNEYLINGKNSYGSNFKNWYYEYYIISSDRLCYDIISSLIDMNKKFEEKIQDILNENCRLKDELIDFRNNYSEDYIKDGALVRLVSNYKGEYKKYLGVKFTLFHVNSVINYILSKSIFPEGQLRNRYFKNNCKYVLALNTSINLAEFVDKLLNNDIVYITAHHYEIEEVK
jgi:hypothetical protein